MNFAALIMNDLRFTGEKNKKDRAIEHKYTFD